MIDRREVITGGVLGSVMGALGSETAVAAAAQSSDNSDRLLGQIVESLAQLRTEVRNQRAFPEIASLRELQKTFLRTNTKLPDFVEVGVDVWYNVYDWHIRWMQQPVVSRDSQNRLTIMLNQTTVIMRTEVDRAFIGPPYDNR